MGTHVIARTPDFIALNNKLVAEYFLIFRINDSYSINEISKFKNKHQLLFQKVEDKSQQLNLMFVDSVFVNILADLALEVLLKNISSIQEYILSKEKIKLVEDLNEVNYFRYKFSDFIHLVLFGDISSAKQFNHELFTDRVFCLKNISGELEYFSIYEQKELQAKLLNESKVEIDYNVSSISNQGVKLCLRFIF